MPFELFPYLYNLYKLRKNQWQSSLTLQELQENKLRALMHHAYYKVDYYRKLFDRVGIKPKDIKSIQDISKIPITTRKEFQSFSRKEIVSKGVDLTHCLLRRTSGSTGTPLDVIVSAREIILRQLLYRRMHFENGGKLTDRLACTIAFPLNFPIHQWFRNLGILKMKYISIFDDIESQLKAILEFKPNIIRGYSSALKNLAIDIKKKKIKGINPRIIFSTAELLTNQDRKFISSIFQAEIFDYYASIECGIIAWECKQHVGYHINSESVIIEFIKEDGTKAKDGEEGELVITSLNSYTMPFIRYRLGDLGIPINEKCPCGRGLPLMKIITGRINDCIILPNGKKVSPYTLMITMDKIPEVKSYQIIQERENKIKIKIFQQELTSFETVIKICQKYKEILGNDINIEPIVIKDTFTAKPGKFKVVISQVSEYDN